MRDGGVVGGMAWKGRGKREEESYRAGTASILAAVTASLDTATGMAAAGPRSASPAVRVRLAASWRPGSAT